MQTERRTPWPFIGQIAAATFLLLANPGRAAEVKLTGPEITELLSDRSLYAGESGEIEQIFQKAGHTFYLQNGTSSQGSWRVAADQYCSAWPPNPAEACYDVTRDGDTVTFVSRSGKTFPMRLKK